MWVGVGPMFNSYPGLHLELNKTAMKCIVVQGHAQETA